jgi:16S rRNA (guanine966-N2)-methyltransferase
MRIIAGAYRGRKLLTTAGLDTRPTSDRLRETLFDILAPRIQESVFLDVCAGSGAVGIEALSRGAARASFIELSRPACSAIGENLTRLGIKHGVALINRDAAQALKSLADHGDKFDIVFFDPPYSSDLYPSVMRVICEGSLLGEDAVVIVEHRAKSPMEEQYGALKRYREVKQGEGSLAFYARELPRETCP